MKEINIQDVKKQAEWEIYIEQFEELVEKYKVKLKSRKRLFPWRVKLVNLNKVGEK